MHLRHFVLPAAILATLVGQVAQAQDQSASATSPAVDPSPDDPSFRAAEHNAIPLTPAMIDELRRRYDAVQDATAAGAANNVAAVPTTRSINVSLGPGGTTSIVQTAPGYPTAISFFDSTGQPWPIAWDTNGIPASSSGGSHGNGPTEGGGTPAVDAVGFDVSVPVKGSNVLQLQPRSPHRRGGVLVNLENAPKPIAFMVVSGTSQYDADISVRVADRGPNAKVAIITRPDTPETGAPYLTAMLDGVPPSQAVPLSVEGVAPDEVRAWQMGDKDYVRTRYTLLSPEWVASEDGADSTTIYAVPATPVVLLSADGRVVAARLGGN
jgi:intracellular multiplication protein IcmK